MQKVSVDQSKKKLAVNESAEAVLLPLPLPQPAPILTAPVTTIVLPPLSPSPMPSTAAVVPAVSNMSYPPAPTPPEKAQPRESAASTEASLDVAVKPFRYILDNQQKIILKKWFYRHIDVSGKSGVAMHVVAVFTTFLSQFCLLLTSRLKCCSRAKQRVVLIE